MKILKCLDHTLENYNENGLFYWFIELLVTGRSGRNRLEEVFREL